MSTDRHTRPASASAEAAAPRSLPGRIDLDREPISFGNAIVTVARHYQAYVDAAAMPYGITSAHVPLLQFLWTGRSAKTQNEIARVIGVDKGTVSRAVRALTDAGLVTQYPCERDTRACMVEITQTGRDLEAPIRAIAEKWNTAVLAGFSAAEGERIAGQLEFALDRADSLLAEAQQERARYATDVMSESLDPQVASIAMISAQSS